MKQRTAPVKVWHYARGYMINTKEIKRLLTPQKLLVPTNCLTFLK